MAQPVALAGRLAELLVARVVLVRQVPQDPVRDQALVGLVARAVLAALVLVRRDPGLAVGCYLLLGAYYLLIFMWLCFLHCTIELY